jgi:hypothetical protein
MNSSDGESTSNEEAKKYENFDCNIEENFSES